MSVLLPLPVIAGHKLPAKSALKFLNAAFQRADGSEHFSELRNCSRRSQPVSMIEGWGASDDFTLRHIMTNTGLRPDNRVFVDRQMAGRSGLARHDHVFLQNRAACQSGLSADDVVLAHDACVTYLTEAVDFCAAFHSSLTYGGAVHGSQRLYLDVVFNHRDAGLWNLGLSAFISLGKAEAVTSDNHSVVDCNPISDAAKFANRGVGVSNEIVADGAAFIDD